MIGQQRLLNKDFPQFVILLGKHRSGKKTLIKEKYKDVVEGLATVDDVRYVISDSSKLTSERTYLFDVNKMNYQSQNTLLKITEEPNEHTRIVITGRFKNQFIKTLQTRATIFTMDNYTREQLESATEKEECLNYYDTIGLLKQADTDTIEVAEKIAENIERMRVSSLFNLEIEDFILFSKPLKYYIKDPEVIKIITEYEHYYDKGYNFILEEMFIKIKEVI